MYALLLVLVLKDPPASVEIAIQFPQLMRRYFFCRYNEVCAYDFDRSEFSMNSGHFTQLVWSDSTEFGIGKASGQQNGMPCTFVVGRFKPSGNYKGEYKRNVFKGNFDPSYCDNLKVKKLL